MAAKSQSVTLEIGGDASKLSKAFDQVGASSKQMADKVDSASNDMRSAGTGGFDSLTESADGAESKFMGFHDVLDGVKGGLETLADPSASMTDKLIGLGQAGADVAGGLASFLLPALQSVWTKLTTTVIPAIWSFTTALLANPITWVVVGILALIAVIVLMVTHWDKVKAVVSGVINWITDRWTGLVDWFKGIGPAIGRALGNVGGFFERAFKSAGNIAIDAVNWMVDRLNDAIYGINVISPFEDIPNIPHIPRLHTGGVVPGMLGEERLMMLQAGERVTPAGQGGGTTTLVVSGTGGLAELINYMVRTGDIQVVQA